MNRTLLFCILLLPAFAARAESNAEAGLPSSVEAGDQVRFQREWPLDNWSVGRVASFDSDTLTVVEESYGDTLILPLGTLTKLQVRRVEGFMKRTWTTVGLKSSRQLDPGSRVRLRIASLTDQPDPWLVGKVVRIEEDHFQIQPSGQSDPTAIETSLITEMNVYRGKSRNRGAIKGAKIACLVGGLYSALYPPGDRKCEEKPGGCPQGLLPGLGMFVLGGAVYAPLGGLVGAFAFAEDHWEPVAVESTVKRE